MINIEKIKQAALAVKGWGNCNQAWLDISEYESAAVVGSIDEDGVACPVITVDCDQYYQGQDSLPLAKFYAQANPSAILELITRLEAAESQLESVTQQARIWKMEALAHKTTVQECYQACTGSTGEPGDWHGANPVKEMAKRIASAKNDAFEQAAKVCETFDPCPGQWSELFEFTQQSTANDCAEAIRQLGKEMK